jgi:spermidine/putrescine transport system substrate-binding protein
MMPEFKAPYKWAMDEAGAELLGMAQRFGPYSYVVNTDKISRAAAEDQGWSLFADPANAGKYGILESDDWNVFNICLVAGFDPSRPTPTTRWRSSSKRPSKCSRVRRWLAISPP